MIKLTTLVLLLAAFFLVLVFYIAPNQGEFIPSTSINTSNLNEVAPQLEEEIPIQEVDVARQGRSILFAITLFGHIQLANLIMGGSWVLLATELLFRRTRKERYSVLGKSMSLFSVILFSVGGTFGGAALLYTFSLYPAFTLNIFHIYWWPVFATLLLWSLQLFFLYMYFYNWKGVGKGWHLSLGLGYALSSFFQALAIITMGSGMLTPNNTGISWGYTGLFTMDLGTLLSWWFNPTLWNLQFHRLAAAIAYFGFLTAVLAMFHYHVNKENSDAMKYWDWVASYGLLWGLAGMAVQPLLGYLYMMQIISSSNGAFQMIMHGPRAWELLWVVGLVSTLVLTTVVYFIDRRETILNQRETRNVSNILKVLLVVAAISAFILVNPGWLGDAFRFGPTAWANPLGAMRYKYIALALLSGVSICVIAIDAVILRDGRESDWGNLPQSAKAAGIFAGILGMWIVMAMGFVRETARAPWVVWNIIPVAGGTAYPTPISLSLIFLTWGGLLVFFLAVFWYVSKVTAESPPKKGEGPPEGKAAGEGEMPPGE
jgi:cytochrome bd-type quinol oxidase subunit 1